MTRTPVRYKSKAAVVAVVAVWVGAILGSIAFWGVVLWAIVKVVNHYT